MERSYSWILLLGLSIVNISAIVDQIPASVRTGKENFALAAACISLIFSFLYTMANLNVGLAGIFVGNIFENSEFLVLMSDEKEPMNVFFNYYRLLYLKLSPFFIMTYN